MDPDTATASSSGIVFDGATKTFDDGTHALGPVGLTIRPGEFVSIVGPSGCGKSTLHRLASGLLEPTSGDVRVGAGNVGYVFQDPTLLPWRTVERNVELLGELHRVPKDERRREAARAIETVGLVGNERTYPRALSGGMKMRTSLARSLTMHPSIFLFDEPFGALDEITRENLNAELARLFDAQQFAGLFVTHSIAEAAFLGTRVVALSARPGRVVLDLVVPFETPRDPEIRYAAEFAEVCGEVHRALLGSHR